MIWFKIQLSALPKRAQLGRHTQFLAVIGPLGPDLVEKLNASYLRVLIQYDTVFSL